MRLPALKESVMIRVEADDEVYAINVDTGDMVRLNKAGHDILQCCQDGLTVDEACERITAGYSEGTDRIRPDIIKTVDRFRELGFIED